MGSVVLQLTLVGWDGHKLLHGSGEVLKLVVDLAGAGGVLLLQIVGGFPLVDEPLRLVGVMVEVALAEHEVVPVDSTGECVLRLELLTELAEDTLDDIVLAVQMVAQHEGLLHARVVAAVADRS